MKPENKLRGIAQYLDEIVQAYQKVDKWELSDLEIAECKAQRDLALELLIRFHLEENLD